MNGAISSLLIAVNTATFGPEDEKDWIDEGMGWEEREELWMRNGIFCGMDKGKEKGVERGNGIESQGQDELIPSILAAIVTATSKSVDGDEGLYERWVADGEDVDEDIDSPMIPAVSSYSNECCAEIEEEAKAVDADSASPSEIRTSRPCVVCKSGFEPENNAACFAEEAMKLGTEFKSSIE